MNAFCHPRFHRGLTLIEMLVVLLIMGLLVSVTTLSMGLAGRSNTDEAARAAEDLSRLLEHAARQAMVTGEVLGLSVGTGINSSPVLQWWRWSSDDTNRAEINPAATLLTTARWQQQSTTFMPELVLPAGFKLQLSDAQSSTPQRQQADNRPDVVLMPGRETVPFEIWLQDVNTGRSLARIISNTDGLMTWSVL